MELNKYLVNKSCSLIEVLKRIDELSELQTIFVHDENGSIIGSITDGDIRRGFMNGYSVTTPLSKFINTSFHYLVEGDYSILKFKEFRKKRLKAVPLLSKSGNLLKLFDLVTTKSILPVDAVIMAGGKGERLRPLTEKTPKPMLPLGDKPIIEHNIDRLISYGVENIYITVNYLADHIMNYFGDGSSKGVNIKYIEEDQFLGTIGSVSMITNFVNPYILVMNSDLFTNVDFEDIIVNMEESNADLSISSIPYTVSIPFGILMREEDRIIGLKEKPCNIHYANAGIYMMKRDVADYIPKNKFYNATDLIEDIIKSNRKVIDIPISGYWIDIGRHEEYDKAKDLIKHINNN